MLVAAVFSVLVIMPVWTPLKEVQVELEGYIDTNKEITKKHHRKRPDLFYTH